MRFYARLERDRRIVVPREVIEGLNIRPGDKLCLEVKEVIRMGTIEVRKIA